MKIAKLILKHPLWFLFLLLLLFTIVFQVFSPLSGHTADLTNGQVGNTSSGYGYGGVQTSQSDPTTVCKNLPPAIAAQYCHPDDTLKEQQPGQTPTPGKNCNLNQSSNWLDWVACFQQGTPTDIAAKIGIDAIKAAAVAFSFLQDSKSNFVLQTPANLTYSSPFIVQQWTNFQIAATALLLVVVAWNSLRMVLKSSVVDYSDALEMAPRVLFAFLAACFSFTFFRFVIELNNAFCSQLQADISAKLLSLIDPNSLSHVGLLYIITGFFYTVLLGLVSLVAAARLAALCILGVTGPLGMLAFASRETEAVGRFWISSLISVTAIQFLQVLALKLGVILFIDQFGHTFVGLLTASGVLVLMLEIPKMMGQAALYSLQTRVRQVTGIAVSVTKTAISLGKAVPS